jgi:hypothetical protein
MDVGSGSSTGKKSRGVVPKEEAPRRAVLSLVKPREALDRCPWCALELIRDFAQQVS